MAVRVVTQYTAGGHPGHTATHDKGQNFTVRDGHLFVLDNTDTNAIATYAPGKWSSASVVDKED